MVVLASTAHMAGRRRMSLLERLRASFPESFPGKQDKEGSNSDDENKQREADAKSGKEE